MAASYIKLGIASLFPVLASVFFYLLEKKSAFGRLRYLSRQLIIGLVFGAIAIIGTEWGIPLQGAMVNCRDAAPLCAGLLFGAPAGIIAGIIGGAERWLAVAWGAGTFTRTACSVSTVIAGFYAAVLRKFMFDDKKPGTLLALAIGFVMEVFHLSMVFITNLNDADAAFRVVLVCAIPMIGFNSLSTMLSTALVSLLSHDSTRSRGERVHISQRIQRWLLVCVMAAFLATTGFTYLLQNGMADRQTESLLTISIQDIQSDIMAASDENLLKLAKQVARLAENNDLQELADAYSIADIVMVDENGIVTACTNPAFVGFDMAVSSKSAVYLTLLNETSELVEPYGPAFYDSTESRKFAGISLKNGFVLVGYDAVQFRKDISDLVTDITRNRHIGETGYTVIAAASGSKSVVSAPDGLDYESLGETAAQIREEDIAQWEVFTSVVNGEECYCMYITTEGYHIISVYPAEEALSNRDIVLYVNSFMEVLAFALMFALIYLLIKKIVVNNIRDINSTLAQITEGNLELTVNVRSSEEFASLSDDINSTVDTLKRYIAEAAARIDKELVVAQSIQSSALPGVFPAFPRRKDFDIYATMHPAKEVGGDFYDFYLGQNDHLYFLIADVSGKGIPAAMFMMRAKTQLKSLAETGMTLDEVFTRGNEDLCEGNDAGMFVTSWMGELDLKTGHLTYVNAGHNFPLFRRADGQFAFEKCRPGFVLAGMEGMKYRLNEVELRPGDTIFLYTDGVTEATDAHTELFGDDRLVKAINALPLTDMCSLCAGVKEAVDGFVAEAPQFDDITMLALHYVGTEPAPEYHSEGASLEDIPVLTELMEAALEKADCPMKTVAQLSIAVDEIYSNIVKFAYNGEPGPATVRVEISPDRESVTLVFIDSGIPYNPCKKEDPNIYLSAEERPTGGLGIYMVKKSMDDMIYEYRGEQNILRLYKKF